MNRLETNTFPRAPLKVDMATDNEIVKAIGPSKVLATSWWKDEIGFMTSLFFHPTLVVSYHSNCVRMNDRLETQDAHVSYVHGQETTHYRQS